MTTEPAQRYEVRFQPAARRAIAQRLPEAVAAAVLEFCDAALAVNPHRVGKPLFGPLAGCHGARRGTYRIVYRIDQNSRLCMCSILTTVRRSTTARNADPHRASSKSEIALSGTFSALSAGKPMSQSAAWSRQCVGQEPKASRLNDYRRNLPVSEKPTECDADQDRALVFEQHRRRLLGVSYRFSAR